MVTKAWKQDPMKLIIIIIHTAKVVELSRPLKKLCTVHLVMRLIIMQSLVSTVYLYHLSHHNNNYHCTSPYFLFTVSQYHLSVS